MEPQWLRWAKRIGAIGQTGLAFAKDPFDIERYEALRTIAAEIMAGYAGVKTGAVRDLLAFETGYATPKVDVRAVVFREGELLLVRERSDGLWTLPGGWGDVGETPSQSVVKEVREESGYEVRATKLLAVYDRATQGHPPQIYDVYKLFIRCEQVGGEALAPSTETSGVGFFPENAIPPFSLLRVLPHQITRMFEHYRNPDLPTDFD